MVTYSIDSVEAGLSHLTPINGRPVFVSLWHLSQIIAEGLRKLSHPDHTDEGLLGYMMSPVVFALYFTEPWVDSSGVCEYFIVPATAITDTD